jgi:predicted RNase H-like HicB family nuclease
MKKAGVMDFTVLLERDSEGWYVAKVPDLPGCHTQGKTIEQALERINEAISAYIESGVEIEPMEFVGAHKVSVAV